MSPAVRVCLVVGVIAWALLSPCRLWAAGNAHVTDDSDVETPGVCHVETWATRYTSHDGLLNVGPACTMLGLPNVEIGAALQHAWNSSASDDTTLGPALKWQLRPSDAGIGVALSGAANINLRTGYVDTSAVVAPVTFALGDRIHLNVDVGWLYTRQIDRHDLFYGVQVEFHATPTLMFMAERFGRNHGAPGDQAGVRWTPGDGDVDIDILIGRRIDGFSPRAVTLGLTVRR